MLLLVVAVVVVVVLLVQLSRRSGCGRQQCTGVTATQAVLCGTAVLTWLNSDSSTHAAAGVSTGWCQATTAVGAVVSGAG